MNIFIERLKTKLLSIKSRLIKSKAILLISWCENHNYNFFDKDSELILKQKSANSEIILRKNSSDIAVFQQVFVKNEYARVIKIIKKEILEPKLFIDCGANIGLTTIKLAQHFPNTKIIAIEPELSNFKQLVRNSICFHEVNCLQHAVWSKKCQIKINNHFRDGLDWSKQTVPSSTGEITALTIHDFIDLGGHRYIDFLKIDIEGTEKEIFKDIETAQFLSKTKILALEIHDEFKIRPHIYNILRAYNFKFFNDVELTIGVNKNLLS
ncbi:MAG TPA: FkbM family methyltransferase [Flavobacterium sp.]|nr:FkbM family methyltransferase [Flavobacterium sp.]